MKNLKMHLARFAEYYFIALIFLAGYTPPFHVMIPAIIVMAFFALQIIFKNKITGIVLGSIAMVVNLYMVLAMISELSEFKTFDASARTLLLAGSAIILANLIVAGLMIGKYIPATGRPTAPEVSYAE